MSVPLAADRVALLELDVDTRLASLWREVPEGTDLDLLAPFMRAAYAFGYVQGIEDDGELCRVHGYERPRRR